MLASLTRHRLMSERLLRRRGIDPAPALLKQAGGYEWLHDGYGQQVTSVTLVGSGTFSRLPEVLARPGMSITLLGNSANPLRSSPFVDTFVEIGYSHHLELGAALLRRRDLLDHLGDWVVFGEDWTPRTLARSELPLATKLRLLPARREVGLVMLGSKTGLAEVQRLADPNAPRTLVVEAAGQLTAACAEIGAPLLIKGEQGGSGSQVVRVATLEGADPVVPPGWFPVVVQEWLPGTDVSVEVMFRDGELAGWTYSEILSRQSEFGQSTSRRYVDPPTLDFPDTLTAMARFAGLHGMFNCTLIRAPAGTHRLVELDPRPNAWHQFGPRLGVDWGALMTRTTPRAPVAHPWLADRAGRELHLYPRELLEGIERLSWPGVAPWVRPRPGTWGVRNRRDRGVNASEDLDIRLAITHAARLTAAIGAGRAWDRLPDGLRRGLARTGARAWAERRIGLVAP
jgi:hypothetical protein